MRIGIDSYSFHRLLGEIRPGERDPGERFRRGSLDVLALARDLGLDGVSLETCFLHPPDRLDAGGLRRAADGLELALAWGHPDGLLYGSDGAALGELTAWVELAPGLDVRLVRLVVASPRVARGPGWRELTLSSLATACEAARASGVELALENHADLTAKELAGLLDDLADPVLGICLDTANAVRVGDDPLAAAELLAARVRAVHLKDVAAPEAAGDPATGPASVPYGEGVVPVEAVLRTLEAAGFGGVVYVELGHLGPGDVNERALVGQCVDWLRKREGAARA